jgi:hypothetical protein
VSLEQPDASRQQPAIVRLESGARPDRRSLRRAHVEPLLLGELARCDVADLVKLFGAPLRHDKVRMPKMSTATLGSRRCPPPTRRISEQSGGQPSGANSAVTNAASRARYSVARFSGCLALRSRNSA